MSAISSTIPDLQAAGEGLKWVSENLFKGLRAGPVVITMGREKRSGDQNDKCHPMIRDIARGMNHQLLGTNEKQWRYFLLANFQGQSMIPSLDGTQIIVVPKGGTSDMLKPVMSEFIEYLYSVGADYNISWSEPSLKAFEEYREAR
jgi:hypothetical protein